MEKIRQESKTSSEIENLIKIQKVAKNRKIGQKSRNSSKIEKLVKNRKLCQKPNNSSKIMVRNIERFLWSYFVKKSSQKYRNSKNSFPTFYKFNIFKTGKSFRKMFRF